MNKPLLLFTLALLLRAGLALLAYTSLPQLGYDSETQQAGYLFYDAFRRDGQAWLLAQSGEPLTLAFSGEYASDQYGGLLWLSAALYRLVGVHAPWLVSLLAALVASLGVFFVYASARRLLNEKAALWAGLVFAVYPESVLLGASQMREPFIITFLAMGFDGFLRWREAHTRRSLGWLAAGLLGLLFISPGFAALLLVNCAGWAWLDGGRKIHLGWLAAAGGVLGLSLLGLALSWEGLVSATDGPLGVFGGWIRETIKWNAFTLQSSSGIVQLLFESLPPPLVMPFVAIYGLLQPVLPAALIEPAVPFWQTLGILRALGWYVLLPLLGFAPFAAFGDSGNPRLRRLMLWLGLAFWVWAVIASVRGGGDQWDNPRYRAIFLPWISLLAVYAFMQIRGLAGRWFWRILAVVGIILVVFGQWYVFRYLQVGFNFGIRNTLAAAFALSILLVGGDWLWQRFRRRG